MIDHHPENERIKRRYLDHLKGPRGLSEDAVDAAAVALFRFEEYTRFRDFKSFHVNQAIHFKAHLETQKGRSGRLLSKATLCSTLANLKRFFQWLSEQSGYRSRVNYSDAEYFNASEKDGRIAGARREPRFPTLEQVKHVIAAMPAGTDIERRNRALVALVFLTGARISAVASFKLKHVDIADNCVRQDAREVKTKFSKTFTTWFLPVGDEIRDIVVAWVCYLREELLWGNDDPLFPATRVAVGENRCFEAAGLDRKPWGDGAPIRKIFREAFEAAGLDYYHPHSFRHTLTQLGQRVCKTPEDFKAWSQNLGHENVMTTFTSYGQVSSNRQAEIIRGLGAPDMAANDDLETTIQRAVQKALNGGGDRGR